MFGSFALSWRQRLHGLKSAFSVPFLEKKNLVFSSSGFFARAMKPAVNKGGYHSKETYSIIAAITF